MCQKFDLECCHFEKQLSNVYVHAKLQHEVYKQLLLYLIRKCVLVCLLIVPTNCQEVKHYYRTQTGNFSCVGLSYVMIPKSLFFSEKNDMISLAYFFFITEECIAVMYGI